MAPLFFVSVVMWVLIVNRALFLRRMWAKNMNRKAAGDCVLQNQPPDPARFRGATALLVTRFIKSRTGEAMADRFILDEMVLTLVKSFDQRLSSIGVLARIAPLLGLLGTVLGMVGTFDILHEFGTGNSRALAGGISEALITTQTGLLIAIPGLYIHGFFIRRAENLKHRVASLGIYLKRFV